MNIIICEVRKVQVWTLFPFSSFRWHHPILQRITDDERGWGITRDCKKVFSFLRFVFVTPGWHITQQFEWWVFVRELCEQPVEDWGLWGGLSTQEDWPQGEVCWWAQQNAPTDYQRIFHFKLCLASLCIFRHSNQAYIYVFFPKWGYQLGRVVGSEGEPVCLPPW